MSKKRNKNKFRNNNHKSYPQKSLPTASPKDINHIAIEIFGSFYYEQQDDKDDILLA